MRINQLDLLFQVREKIGKIKVFAALIILLPGLSYAGITDKIVDDFKAAATSTYKTLGGYSDTLSGYANSAYQKVSSFSVNDSIKSVTGTVGGVVGAGSQYINKLSVSNIQNTIRNNNTYQAITTSWDSLSSQKPQQSQSITEQISGFLQTKVLSPLSGAYSVFINTISPPSAAGGANEPMGDYSFGNVTAFNASLNNNFKGDNSRGEGLDKTKTSKDDSFGMVIFEHKKPDRSFKPWMKMYNNAFPMNMRPRHGKGFGGLNKIQRNSAKNNADLKEIKGAFDLFEKEVGGFLVDNSSASTVAVNTNNTAVASSPQTTPYCKDCHGSNVPVNAVSSQKDSANGQGKTYSLSTQRVETQTQVFNKTDINPASVNDPIGSYRNDGKRVSDQSIYDPRYDVSRNSGNTTSPIIQRYQPTAQDQQVRRSAVMQDMNGTAYYQEYNGTTAKTVSLNKPYDDYAKETLVNTQNNATKSVTLFNGQTYDVSRVVFSPKTYKGYKDKQSGVVTTDNKFIPAYMIDKGKTDSGEYAFALPKNITAYANASQQSVVQKEASSSVNTQVQVSATNNVVNQQVSSVGINPAVTSAVTQSTTVNSTALMNMYKPAGQDQRQSVITQDKNGLLMTQSVNSTKSANNTQSLNEVLTILGMDKLYSSSQIQNSGTTPSAIIGMKKEVSILTNTTSAVNSSGYQLQAQSSGVNLISSTQGPACKDCHGSNVPVNAVSVQKDSVNGQGKTYSLSTQRVETQTQVFNKTDINPASVNDPIGSYRNDGKRVSDQSIYDPRYDVSRNSGNTTSPIIQRYQPTAQDQQVRRSSVLQDRNGTAYYQQFNGTSAQTVSLNKPYNDYAKETLVNTQNNATKSVQLFNGQTYDVSKVVFASKADSYDERTSGVVTTDNTFIPAYMIDKGKTDSGEYTFALPRNIAAYTNASQHSVVQKEASSSVNTQVQSSATNNVVNQQASSVGINPAATTVVTQSTTVKSTALMNMYKPTAQDQQVRRSSVLQDINGTAYYQEFNGTATQAVSLNKPYNDYAKETLANTRNNATKSVQLFNGQTYDVSKVVFASKADSYDERTSGVVTTDNTFIPAYMINKGITDSGEYIFALPRNMGTFQKDSNNNF